MATSNVTHYYVKCLMVSQTQHTATSAATSLHAPQRRQSTRQTCLPVRTIQKTRKLKHTVGERTSFIPGHRASWARPHALSRDPPVGDITYNHFTINRNTFFSSPRNASTVEQFLRMKSRVGRYDEKNVCVFGPLLIFKHLFHQTYKLLILYKCVSVRLCYGWLILLLVTWPRNVRQFNTGYE